MKLELTGQERLQFQYILPGQGSLAALELVDSILKKVKIDDVKDVEIESIKSFDFQESEIILMQDMIRVLDQGQQLSLQSLPLIRKILNINGEHENE